MRFLCLPDSPAAARVGRGLAARGAPRLVEHASGRPWLVGWWDDTDATVIRAGTRALVLLGPARLDGAAARRALAWAHGPHDARLDAALAAASGSFHAATSIDGRVRVRGSLSTLRQVFRTRVDGVPVACGDAGLAADVSGASLDDDALALRLLLFTPWPLATACVWRGVTQVPPGAWLELAADGASRTVPWWTPPAPETPLADAVPLIADALHDAVAARPLAALSSDLSGGLDSTSLCFLADAHDARLTTLHWRPADPGNPDARWAATAARLLPRAQHLTVEADEAPQWSAEGVADVLADHSEGPPPWGRNRARLDALGRAVGATGSRTHLMGAGGDELFATQPAFLWSYVHAHPLRGAAFARRCQVLNRWAAWPLVRGLADFSSFPRALAAAARDVTRDPVDPARLPLGWFPPPRLPAWASDDAVAVVRRLLRQAAEEVDGPLVPDRARHQVVESVLIAGACVRQMRGVLARHGIAWEAPFLDDRVVDAALAVRLEDRVVQGAYKPVLVAAMRGTVPDELLGRRDKGEFSAEAFAGLDRNRRALLALCDGSQLAERGLVDADALRAAVAGPRTRTHHVVPFEATLGCETWLRALAAAEPGPWQGQGRGQEEVPQWTR